MESSARPVSVSVVEDRKILGTFYINTKQTHSQTLMPMIESTLKNTEIDINTIDAFAIAKGPGSFTGVRIGISAIKGMAMASCKPCIGVSTLEAIAYNLNFFDGIVCAIMDARCDQVYNALFECSNGVIRRLTEDRAITIEDLSKQLNNFKESVNLVGDGANLCYNKLVINCGNVKIVPEHLKYQNSIGVAMAAFNMIDIHPYFVSADKLFPEYLRLPQAERELKKKLKQ